MLFDGGDLNPRAHLDSLIPGSIHQQVHHLRIEGAERSFTDLEDRELLSSLTQPCGKVSEFKRNKATPHEGDPRGQTFEVEEIVAGAEVLTADHGERHGP